RPKRVATGTRACEQMPDEQGRVTHHVVQYAAALQLSLPEPRPVRPAVLLGRTGQVRRSRQLCTTRPENRTPVFDLRGEHLILEIAVAQSDALHEGHDVLGLGDVS